MKKVDNMSIQDMESYFRNVERIKRVFHRSYRIFWPFNAFSPFSPSRIVLNFGVIMTWISIMIWAFQGGSQNDLISSLAGLWVIIMIIYLIIGLLERHYRITSRYRQMTGSRFHFRMPWHSRPEPQQRVYYQTNTNPDTPPPDGENPNRNEENPNKEDDPENYNPLRDLLIKLFR